LLLLITDLEPAMHQHWRAIKHMNKTKRSEDDEELTLSAFNETCFNCGKKGHKSTKSKKKAGGKTGKGKFAGKCNACGKPGHMARTCWENDENAYLRPKNWTSGKGSEVAAIAAVELLLGAIDGVTEDDDGCVLCNQDMHKDVLKDDDDAYDIIRYDESFVDDSIKSKARNEAFGLTGITFFPISRALLTDPNVFIADTGSTVHSTRFKSGFKNAKKGSDNDVITMGKGAREGTAMIGDLQGTMCTKEGNELAVATLKDVAYLLALKFNLFSVTKLQQDGWILHGDKDQIKLTKGNCSVVFNIVIDTPKGAIFAMYLKRNTELASVATDVINEVHEQAPISMTIKQACERFGHANKEATCKAASHLGIKITRGTLKVCEACPRAKAKQKNVNKYNVTHELALTFPKRVFIDIATVKSKEGQPAVTNPNWLIIVDEATKMKFSFFYATKNGMIQPTCELFNKWKQQGYVVVKVQMDNAGENRKFQEHSQSADWKLNLEFGSTARDMQQQNHLAESGFAVLSNKARTLMMAAHLPFAMHYAKKADSCDIF
jgi:hypothetical protein